jgi:hypothetical protein
MSRTISFRGKLADLAQETIPLGTIRGEVGYRITKLQLIGSAPGVETVEAIVKIYKTEQTGVPTGLIDLSDNTLIAAAFYVSSQTEEWSTHNILVFDNEIFNQDIYVTHFDASVGQAVNYYIELEQMPLDLNENTVATLKDIRNVG